VENLPSSIHFKSGEIRGQIPESFHFSFRLARRALNSLRLKGALNTPSHQYDFNNNHCFRSSSTLKWCERTFNDGTTAIRSLFLHHFQEFVQDLVLLQNVLECFTRLKPCSATPYRSRHSEVVVRSKEMLPSFTYPAPASDI
jgi:hypothetical protein